MHSLVCTTFELKRNEIVRHCMHKKRFQLNHTSNILSSDEVPIIEPKLCFLTKIILAKYSYPFISIYLHQVLKKCEGHQFYTRAVSLALGFLGLSRG